MYVKPVGIYSGSTNSMRVYKITAFHAHTDACANRNKCGDGEESEVTRVHLRVGTSHSNISFSNKMTRLTDYPYSLLWRKRRGLILKIQIFKVAIRVSIWSSVPPNSRNSHVFWFSNVGFKLKAFYFLTFRTFLFSCLLFLTKIILPSKLVFSLYPSSCYN